MTMEEQLDAWLKARFSPQPLSDLPSIEPTRVEMIPMRDGVRLYSELFFPEDPALEKTMPFPVILVRSCYPWHRPSVYDKMRVGEYLAAGYIVVYQLVRGIFLSEGSFRWLKNEANDGYDCIDWIADQAWCNGDVGMTGASYLSMAQLLAAATKPAALRCITPCCFPVSGLDAFPYSGGILVLSWLMTWYHLAETKTLAEQEIDWADPRLLEHPKWGPAFRTRPLMIAADGVLTKDQRQSWYDSLAHPLNDGYWDDCQLSDQQLAELDLPLLMTDGWLDPAQGPSDYFQRLERASPGRFDRFLLVGPWDHGQVGSSKDHHLSHGEREMPKNAAVDFLPLYLAFFDRYLKGNKETEVQSSPVRVYVTGANVWQNFSTFPAPETQAKCLYLHSKGDACSLAGNGRLIWDLFSGQGVDQMPDSYRYNPHLPTPSWPKEALFNDQRQLEIRADCLIYTSDPLPQAMTLLGEITLVLYAASSAKDTDWIAQLTEVYPDGRSIAFHASFGGLRARYHKGFDKETFLQPNEPTKFTVRLGCAGHQIAAGNRLRLRISSSSFPASAPNTNTGNPPATDTGVQIAKQTVFHDSSLPSHLILPVIELN